METLKTNYKDDILDTSANTQRKYRMVNNADGTISLEDVTVYTQNGDSFGAADINKTNQAVLDLNSSLNDLLVTKNFSGTTNEGGNLPIECPEGYEPVHVNLDNQSTTGYIPIINNHFVTIMLPVWNQSQNIPYIKYVANAYISGTVLYLKTRP